MSQTGPLWDGIRSQHPPVREALREDARAALRHRGEGSTPVTPAQIVRLAWVSDAFMGLLLYRLKARLQARGIPLLPRLAHRLALLLGGVSIGDPVVMAAGVYIMHGPLVVDGLVRIGRGVVLGPFVTIGLRAGDFNGPTIEDDVHVGAGAKIIGPVRVGAGAVIGAGAVVVGDVAPGSTVVGVPARPI